MNLNFFFQKVFVIDQYNFYKTCNIIILQLIIKKELRYNALKLTLLLKLVNERVRAIFKFCSTGEYGKESVGLMSIIIHIRCKNSGTMTITINICFILKNNM